MAARSVIKLISKTCPYHFSATAPSCRTLSSSGKPYNVNKPRSFSQPARISPKSIAIVSKKSSIHQVRKLSKSLHNLKIHRRNYQETEDHVEVRDDPVYFRERYTTRTSTEPKREEIEISSLLDEDIHRKSVVYEIDNSSKPKDNIYNVIDYMTRLEKSRPRRLFPHIQPCKLAPYGSNENLLFPSAEKRRASIIYPTSRKSVEKVRKKVDEVKPKQLASYVNQKEYPGYEEAKKVAVCEKTSRNAGLNKKNYSTTCNEVKRSAPPKPRPYFGTKKSTDRLGLTITKSVTGRSSTLLSKKKPQKKVENPVKSKIEDILAANNLRSINLLCKQSNESKLNPVRKLNTNNKVTRKSDSRNSLLKMMLNKQRVNPRDLRSYNTYATDTSSKQGGEYIAVKLEDPEKIKLCKRRKIKFGTLPKMKPPDCPCFEEPPLKEGKPLNPLKKRSEPKEKPKDCRDISCDNPRADDNLKTKKKRLPKLELDECPCIETEMVDFTIRRLPKKNIPEPPRVCPPCVECEICPRSDETLEVKRKSLPKLKVSDCPCLEPQPPEDKPLVRLKPVKVHEPPRECPDMLDCDIPRADDNLQVEKKCLPKLTPKCVCIEQAPPEDTPPLPRLRKIKYVEKPRICQTVACENIRADDSLKVKKKRLPVFKPQSCPCIEEEMPSKMVYLKRLEPRYNLKEKDRTCDQTGCDNPRADDGMVIKPKRLPQIEVKECPCVEEELVDCPPLKRLIPIPVPEPPRICDTCEYKECCPPRSDDGLKIKPKTLPALPPGSCPCIEPDPIKDVPPLAKLKRRNVTHEPPCPKLVICDTPRADDNLKVKHKRLPKLEANKCPCIEPPELEKGKPLKRLHKVHIPEPAKVCEKTDDCDETPRADEDCWMYWNKEEVEEKRCPGDPEPSSTSNRRNYSTKRYYSTSTKRESNMTPLKYDVASLGTNHVGDKPYDIVIDIKPSPPLVLTQQAIRVTEGITRSESVVGRNRQLKPLDCVAFVIYKSSNLGITKSKSNSSMENSNKIKSYADISLLFNTINRFISTYNQQLHQYANKSKDHQTPSCECPPNEGHLQPKNPIIKEAETFMMPFPKDDTITASIQKSRTYHRERLPDRRDVEGDDEEALCEKQERALCEIQENISSLDKLCPDEKDALQKKDEKKLTLWERIVNYFKARPDCPTPEEFKRMRLIEEAEKAASKAGLCLYDPKEMLRKNEKELPKVITAKGPVEDNECKN